MNKIALALFVVCVLVSSCTGAGDSNSPGDVSNARKPLPADRHSTHLLAGRWAEGKNYDLLSLPIKQAQGPTNRVEVIEFFQYGCPFCYDAEPFMVQWNRSMKPDYVTFVHVPVSWSTGLRGYAKLYYCLHLLGRDDLQSEIFDTIFRRGNPLYFRNDDKKTFESQLTFAVEHGVNAEAFKRTYDSPEVAERIRLGEELRTQDKIEHTPSFVVDGRYLTSPGRVDQHMYEIPALLNALAEQAHADHQHR